MVRQIEPGDRLHNGILALALLRRVTLVAVIHDFDLGKLLHVLSLMIHDGMS